MFFCSIFTFFIGLVPNLIGVTPEKAIKLATNDWMRDVLFNWENKRREHKNLQAKILGKVFQPMQLLSSPGQLPLYHGMVLFNFLYKECLLVGWCYCRVLPSCCHKSNGNCQNSTSTSVDKT
jgi:hypothetical protein